MRLMHLAIRSIFVTLASMASGGKICITTQRNSTLVKQLLSSIGARVVGFLNNVLFHNYKQGNIIFDDLSHFLNDSCNGPIKYALIL